MTSKHSRYRTAKLQGKIPSQLGNKVSRASQGVYHDDELQYGAKPNGESDGDLMMNPNLDPYLMQSMGLGNF